jgi:hypothetical protein
MQTPFPPDAFFQYFNPFNARLQVVDLIVFSPKASPDLEGSHPLMGCSNC